MKGETMGLTEKNMLCEELRKNELCQYYWSKQIECELEKDIQLTHEPVGDMAIYSKCFEFHTQYSGDKEELRGTTAIIKIRITANQPGYDLEAAAAGKDCFHNIRVIVNREGKELLTAKFRLWDKEEPVYSGDKKSLKMLLQD